MRSKFPVTLLLMTGASTGLLAQSLSLITGREPVSSLDGLWRFHAGDNPAWGTPNYDDSNWPLIRSDERWDVQGYNGYNRFAWYSFSIQYSGGKQKVWLLLTAIATSYPVYADGKLLGAAGISRRIHADCGPIMFQPCLGSTSPSRRISLSASVLALNGFDAISITPQTIARAPICQQLQVRNFHSVTS